MGFDFVLAIDEVLFFLNCSFLLLLLDHLAHLRSFHNLGFLLLFEFSLNHLFLQFCLVRSITLVVDGFLLFDLSPLLLLFSSSVVHLCLSLLVSLFLLPAHLLHLVGLVVALALIKNFVSTLPSLLNLFNGLKIGFS